MEETVAQETAINEKIEPMAETVSQPKSGENALGISSVVVGVLSFFVLTIILGPVALWLGLKSKREEGSQWALAGIIIGSIATGIAVLSLLTGVAALGFLASSM